MNQFGFNVLKRTTIVVDEEPLLWQQLVDNQPLLGSCIGCGACTAVCPRSSSHKISVRQALLRIQRDVKLDMKPDDCIMCNKCALVCPRNLNTRLVWFALNNLENGK